MVVSNKIFEDHETSIAAGRKLARPSDEETIVISGLSGTFPESEDVEVFQQKLFDKSDMITDDNRRWTCEHPEIPHRTGKVPSVNKFDASFFGIHYNQAETMDPMCRILLEKAYEAVIDSGTNPNELKGTKTGVFVGACYSESEKAWFYEKLQANGFAVTGCVRSMMANRISYYLGLDGPSCTIDTACSSSMYAFEYGYRAIREGLCEAAIIGGCNLCLHPFVSLQFSRLGVLSLDGKCKPFDTEANGYCRSESICAVLLQKKKDANRIYASVVHAKTNCDGFKEQGITYPSGEIQHKLFENFYAECEVDPLTLNYVEAHGTGTKVGDPEEIKALVKAFGEGRTTPLKIGSVKSNIGHTEPVSGLCSITKVIIAMETGLIPPTINLNNLRTDIEALQDGTFEVITEPTPWELGLVGINSFGFGGANCHILLKSNDKDKINGGFPNDDIPRLVNTSGRTYEAVEKIFKKLQKSPFDVELCKLFHNIHKTNIQGHNFRGFITLKKGESNFPIQSATEIKAFTKRKPLYYYFPGLFTDLKNFDKTLLEIPIFSNVMTKLSRTLSMDIFNVMNNIESKFSDIIGNFVAVSAIQIAMVDLLKSLGIVPDKIVGSSIGEIACAYADGCITAEEAILTSYYIAAALKEINFTPYLMVHIGMTASELKSMVPSQIEISAVCAKTSTAVGPKQLIKSLLDSLKMKKISFDKVNTFETPMHSSFVKSAKTKMLSYLKEVIKSNKSISPKWISSVISDKCNGEYFCANILDSLQYDSVLRMGDEALIFEIGPDGSHHLSNMIVNKVLDKTYGTNCSSFVSSLGRLYVEGFDMDPSVLYPEVSMPVSRSTPMISPFLSWDHSQDWYVIIFKEGNVNCGEKTVSITLTDEDTEYISGHLIDGRNLYPATGYLALVWETIGNNLTKHFSEVPIVIENVKFHRATTLSKDGNIDFTVLVQRASGYFEVIEGGAAIVTGRISVPENIDDEMSNLKSEKNTESFPMSTKDFYKELRLRGYNYKGLFRSVVKANVKECEGAIKWHKNWVAFMDNMLQMQIILSDTRGLFVPTSIDRIVIDPKKHLQYIERFEDTNEIPVVVYPNAELIKSGGIEIYGLKANAIARRKNLGEPVLEKYHFVPHESNIYDRDQVIRIMVQTALENESTVNVKVTEIPTNRAILSPIIAQVLGDLPLLQPEITVLTNPNNPLVEGIAPEIMVEEKKIVTDQSAMIVVASNVLKEENRQLLDSCLYAMKEGGFLIARENLRSSLEVNFLQQIQSYIVDDEEIVLLRKVKEMSSAEDDKVIIEVSRENLDWLPKAQEAINNEKMKRVYFVSQNDKLSGVIGLVNCIRKEPGGTKARCIFTFDDNVPKFSLTDAFYTSQLNKDLAINIFKNGTWGTYRHLLIEIPKEVKAEYVYANNLVRGDLSSMTWLQANTEELMVSGPEKVADVYYSALNFRDVMLCTGKIGTESVQKERLKQECVIGFEFSGYLNGKRIMGLIPTKALSSKVKVETKFYWEVPDEWTLEDAATVPVVYLTTIYGIVMAGNLKEGDSILIHSGTGGVGQAAINIALSYGCTVFTTVGTPEKRRFLLENFPQLSERNIGNSRDTSFEEMIMRETNGRGVDLVLNSLAEEKLLASVRCLAYGGRFVEIGKFDITNNNAIGMEIYKRGAKIFGIMLDNHFDKTTMGVQEKMGHEIMLREIRRGSVKPLIRTTFKKEEIEQAFRYMASGKHMGKILIKVNEEGESAPSNKARLYKCKPKFYADIKGCYVVTGGLGGFGLELADWLVLRGAKNLILVSRKGVTNGYQDLRINTWKSYGVNVLVSTLDVTKSEGVAALLEQAESLAPVKGIFNLAVVLRDGIFGNQTNETFRDSMGPKADSTVYLDQHSRKMCPELEHFVVFSSVSCGRGNGGQTNYGWSNSVMERVCEKREEEGFPATAIQWGAVGDAGLVAEMQDEHIEIVIGGTLQQRIISCLETLDGYLTQKYAIVSSMVVAEKKAGGASGENIVDCVANILGLRDLKNVSLHSTLAELGMDSMMAVEIKQTLEREYEVFLSPQDIRAITFAKLFELSTIKEEKGSDEDSTIEKQPLINLAMMINLLGQRENAETIELVRSSSNKAQNNHVFIAPGIEGESGILDDIGQLIESNVYLIQFNNKHCETVEDLSSYILPHILNVLTPGSSYNLVGYSWGGLPIIDMAYKLEKLGYSGKICFVDSSPALMREIHKYWNSGDLQMSILYRVIEILCPEEKSKLDKILEGKDTWEDRLDVVVQWSKLFAPNLKSIINGIYYRSRAIDKLKDIPEKSLKSPILLIRPTEVVMPIEKDYGISKYTTATTTLKFVEGNHLTVIKDKATAEAINLFMGFQDNITTKIPILNTTANINAIKENVKNI